MPNKPTPPDKPTMREELDALTGVVASLKVELSHLSTVDEAKLQDLIDKVLTTAADDFSKVDEQIDTLTGRLDALCLQLQDIAIDQATIDGINTTLTERLDTVQKKLDAKLMALDPRVGKAQDHIMVLEQGHRDLDKRTELLKANADAYNEYTTRRVDEMDTRVYRIGTDYEWMVMWTKIGGLTVGVVTAAYILISIGKAIGGG